MKKTLISLAVVFSLLASIGSANATIYHRLKYKNDHHQKLSSNWLINGSYSFINVKGIPALNKYFNFKANKAFYAHCQVTKMDTAYYLFSAVCHKPSFTVNNVRYKYGKNVKYKSLHRHVNAQSGGYMAKNNH